MKKVLLLCITLFALFSVSAQSEKKDYSNELNKDAVEIIDNQYVSSTYFLMKASKNSSNVQIKLSSTAPKAIISRDNFVMYTTGIFTMYTTAIMLSSTEDFELDDLIVKELDEPIGEVDLTISITMTKNGMQITFSSSEGKESETMTWDEWFE